MEDDFDEDCCEENEDEIHCQCWYDGHECCSCGELASDDENCEA